MTRADFWFNGEARRLGTSPTGTRAGQFVFLSAQTPIDLSTGAVVRTIADLPEEARKSVASRFPIIDVKFGPARAQTWQVYRNLASILSSQGLGLDDVVKQRIFLVDPEETAAIEQQMLTFFPQDKPATTIVGMAPGDVDPDIHLQVELVALLPGPLGKETVRVPELEPLTRPYPQGVKVGQLLFLSGFTGIHPESGRLVTHWRDLGDDAREATTGAVASDGTNAALEAQMWTVYRHFARVLETQGAGLRHILRKNAFYRATMKEAAARNLTKEKLFPALGDAPPVTAFGVKNLSSNPDVRMVADAIALLPGSSHKEVDVVPERTVGAYPMWAKGASLWLNSGEIPVHHAGGRPVQGFADLDSPYRFLGAGRIHRGGRTLAQACRIYESLHEMLAKGGSAFSRVVWQHVYMRRPSEYPLVERAAVAAYSGQVPPTTLVAVDDIGPFPELDVEIELIATV
jgi:enamine deaminase RidA (YjgF/YER057c/UK114 family)